MNKRKKASIHADRPICTVDGEIVIRHLTTECPHASQPNEGVIYCLAHGNNKCPHKRKPKCTKQRAYYSKLRGI